MFRDLESMHKLIKEYCQGKDEEVKTTKKDSPTKEGKGAADDSNNFEQEELEAAEAEKKKKNSPKKGASSSAYKIKHNTFIIQKYIEKPLLLFNRKFDIRVWVLLDQDHDLYFFKEGYLRTSSSEFSIDL